MAKIAMTSDKKIMVLNEGVEGIPSITVDSELSNTSTNPVQNKVVKAAIDAVNTKVENKQNKIGVSGLLKGDGTTISAAVPGTDYAVPSTEPVVTPHIGDNGNWFIGDTDTGKPSRGANGTDGKSAYASAQDGGFTGTEAQFNRGLSVMGSVSGIDTTVTQNSGNLITSGAVYSYIQSLDGNGVNY